MLNYLRAALIVRLGSERGASAVEYAMIVAGVGVIIGVTLGFREVLRAVFADSIDGVSIDETP